MEEKKTGKIKYLNIAKGYGFIQCIEMGKDIFFHARACVMFDLLKIKDKVDFGLIDSPKGICATEVSLQKLNK